MTYPDKSSSKLVRFCKCTKEWLNQLIPSEPIPSLFSKYRYLVGMKNE